MFCPACSKKNDIEQKFCRACGMNLEQIAATLAEHLGDGEESDQKKIDRFFNSMGKFAFGGLLAIGVVGVIALLYTIFTKMILTGDRVLFGIILSLFIVFAALTLSWVVHNESKKDRKPKLPRSSENENELKGPDTLRSLPDPIHDPVPSVIEDTTKLLRKHVNN